MWKNNNFNIAQFHLVLVLYRRYLHTSTCNLLFKPINTDSVLAVWDILLASNRILLATHIPSDVIFVPSCSNTSVALAIYFICMAPTFGAHCAPYHFNNQIQIKMHAIVLGAIEMSFHCLDKHNCKTLIQNATFTYFSILPKKQQQRDEDSQIKVHQNIKFKANVSHR